MCLKLFMAKILPQQQLLKRRDFAILEMAFRIIQSSHIDDTNGLIFLSNESPKFISLNFVGQNPEPVSLSNISKYSFEPVTSHHLRMVPKIDLVDKFFGSLKLHSNEPFAFDQDRLKGTIKLTLSPEGLVFALKETARNNGINVEDPQSEFAILTINALADTQYLTRMTKKASLRPLLQ